MQKLIAASLFLPFIGITFILSCSPSQQDGRQVTTDTAIKATDSALLKEYDFSGLRTDFSKHSVPLDSIHDGGVSKNGIPAIDFPEFISVEAARGFLTEPDYGILLHSKSETRFYPFNILNWHEVVNDVLDTLPVAITFCPLCGSAIVYERLLDGDTLQFGVSGRLYESNLLMFDDKSESLWSQAMGEAVAGKYTGMKLKLLNTEVVSFEEVVEDYPSAKILSPKTGYDRNYMQNPYGDYMTSEELYFPVSHSSKLFPAKQMMYVVSTGSGSIAFDWLSLLKKGNATVKSPEGIVSVLVKKNIPYATINGQPQPGYFSFWFSWFTHYGKEGLVWPDK
ncbi:MAG: DUF3179 domain-containing protein [Chitinophagales bacterium]|nr:DUF3179 domain-containing protein [Chitinophagales bacterium]